MSPCFFNKCLRVMTFIDNQGDPAIGKINIFEDLENSDVDHISNKKIQKPGQKKVSFLEGFPEKHSQFGDKCPVTSL